MSASYVTIQGGSTFNLTLSQDQRELQRSWIRLFCKTSGGAITINLPKISDFGTGLDYRILIDDADDNAGTNPITINCDPSNTIDNGASYVINANGNKAEIYVSSLTEFAVLTNGGAGSPIIPILYADLLALATGSTMVAGQKYLITDFRTKHNIPFTADTFTGMVEPLLVQAITGNKLLDNASSTLFANDEILYELVDTTSQGGDMGRIYYRCDLLNSVSTFYDWRNVKFRRWETSAGSGNFLIYYDNGFAYQDFYTFENIQTPNPTTCYNVEMKKYVTGGVTTLNNNVFAMYCYNNTLGDNCYNNNFGLVAINNVIEGNFGGNLIGDYFMNNKIGKNFTDNTIALMFHDNLKSGALPFVGNQIGHDFYKNTIAGTFNYNTISFNMYGNYIYAEFIGNNIGQYCTTNTFFNDFSSNWVGDQFTYNYTSGLVFGSNIGDTFQQNQITGLFAQSTIGDNFNANTILNASMNVNSFGDNVAQNLFSSGYYNNNIFGDGFINNNINAVSSMNGVDFTLATFVKFNYSKSIQLNSAGVLVLSYLDNLNVLTVVVATA